jgi:DNA-directed RNA polymerase subunit RPC12/RpoP
MTKCLNCGNEIELTKDMIKCPKCNSRFKRMQYISFKNA